MSILRDNKSRVQFGTRTVAAGVFAGRRGLGVEPTPRPPGGTPAATASGEGAALRRARTAFVASKRIGREA